MKLILDTDIGTNVDDAWALALCLASEEIELLGVSLVHADLETRARIALKMLKLAGCPRTPVCKGLSSPLTPGAPICWSGHEGAGVDFSDVDITRLKDDAVGFIIDSADRYPGELMVAVIGPQTNIAEAIRRSPETMRRVRKLLIMAGTFNGEGPENAGSEHNIRLDPDAAAIVLQSGIPALVAGLNVTKKMSVSCRDLAEIECSPLGLHLSQMTRQYQDVMGSDFAFVHDTLPILSLIDPSVVKTRRLAVAEVKLDGRVVYAQASGSDALDVCVDVDVTKSHRLLMQRICSLRTCECG